MPDAQRLSPRKPGLRYHSWVIGTRFMALVAWLAVLPAAIVLDISTNLPTPSAPVVAILAGTTTVVAAAIHLGYKLQVDVACDHQLILDRKVTVSTGDLPRLSRAMVDALDRKYGGQVHTTTRRPDEMDDGQWRAYMAGFYERGEGESGAST